MLDSKEKEVLKNKLAKGNLKAIKDSAARLRGAISFSFRLEIFYLFSNL